MKLLDLRVFFIFLGVLLIFFSNIIFDIFYPGVSSVVFELTKINSIMIIGLVLALIGILFPFSDKPKN
ncbi:hypothetical protein VOI00_003062 [Clostridium perfringens]